MEKYHDLFEDEVAEILRELKPQETVIANNGTDYYYKVSSIFEDGILSKVDGYFKHYSTNWKGNCIETMGYLVDILAHKDFIVRRENE